MPLFLNLSPNSCRISGKPDRKKESL
ncbi:hypothetical protein KUV27_18220 [Cytobacillus firmus]|nr:hypothetical protein [Cytobacillus firmus]